MAPSLFSSSGACNREIMKEESRHVRLVWLCECLFRWTELSINWSNSATASFLPHCILIGWLQRTIVRLVVSAGYQLHFYSQSIKSSVRLTQFKVFKLLRLNCFCGWMKAFPLRVAFCSPGVGREPVTFPFLLWVRIVNVLPLAPYFCVSESAKSQNERQEE